LAKTQQLTEISKAFFYHPALSWLAPGEVFFFQARAKPLVGID